MARIAKMFFNPKRKAPQVAALKNMLLKKKQVTQQYLYPQKNTNYKIRFVMTALGAGEKAYRQFLSEGTVFSNDFSTEGYAIVKQKKRVGFWTKTMVLP